MPPIPPDVKACILKETPYRELRTKTDVKRFIAQLRRSEKAKTYCGRRLINLYEKHKALFEGN